MSMHEPSSNARSATTSTTRPEGSPREGFPAGTAWADVPDEWNCPDCGVREKVDFESMEVSK